MVLSDKFRRNTVGWLTDERVLSMRGIVVLDRGGGFAKPEVSERLEDPNIDHKDNHERRGRR